MPTQMYSCEKNSEKGEIVAEYNLPSEDYRQKIEETEEEHE